MAKKVKDLDNQNLLLNTERIGFEKTIFVRLLNLALLVAEERTGRGKRDE